MTGQKSYYAIIPANVRYDKDLPPNAKLLYGEITALCNEKGYCWAENKYFADLYGVSKTSISKWIGALCDKGYIRSRLIYKEGSKEIDKRYITIVNDPIEKKLNTSLTKVKDPIKQKLKDNITSNTTTNNTFNNKNNIVITDSDTDAISEIITYLNKKLSTRYRVANKVTRKHITARLKEGFTVDDFKVVIDKKANEWLGTEMEQYLRPETLFGTKFESYLNAKINKSAYQSRYSGNSDRVTINGKEYEKRNGKYYIPGGSGVAVDPYKARSEANDEFADLPF